MTTQPTDPPRDDLPAAEVQRMWDRRFNERDVAWEDDPNRFVVEEVSPLTPGHALDLAAGDGRNAIWLVRRGWTVTAVDISTVGLARLRERTFGSGAEITTIHADLRRWRPEPRSADLVLLAYAHLRQPHRGALHRAAAAAVRPGGRLLLIAHDRSNLVDGVGGPQDPGVLPTAGEVSEELEILRSGVVEREVEGEDRPALDLLAVATRPRTGQ